MMRLDKMLANLGYGSRKEVKSLIRKGHIRVNSTIIKKDDYRLEPDIDKVYIDDTLIVYKPLVYIMMNKPQGVISATEDKVHKTVVDLIEGYDHYHVYPVGRLDKDTEGLMLLTNDGILARELLFPSKKAEKKYYARLKYDHGPNDEELFEKGITIDTGYRCQSARLAYLSKREAYVIITEGKFHQVKKMFEAVGNEVVYLKRLEMKGLILDPQLKPGEYRELTEEEMDILHISQLHANL